MSSDNFNGLLTFTAFKKSALTGLSTTVLFLFLQSLYHCYVERDIIFGIATRYGLDGKEIESR